jgi:hypothetical protein
MPTVQNVCASSEFFNALDMLVIGFYMNFYFIFFKLIKYILFLM